MSAISARVSPIPGAPDGHQPSATPTLMAAFKELVGCEAFANHKGMLPIILGKDTAGEPIVADLATLSSRQYRCGFWFR